MPVRNVRRVATGSVPSGVCAQPTAGGIEKVSLQDAKLTIEGWAPWQAETGEQGIRVLSARGIRADSIATITRPDIAERLQDYRMAKCGFKLRISSTDGKPLRPEDLTLLAFGTSQGEVRLSCCHCP